MSAQKKLPKKFLIPFLGLFFCVGVAVFSFGVVQLREAMAAESWPTTDGVVVSSQVITRTYHDSDRGTRRTYGAEVVYRYSVGGAEYESDRFSFGAYSSNNPSHARGIVRQYSPGSAVTVYYNPENPATAVLETGVGGGNYILLGVGSAFAIFGGGLLVLVCWLKDGPEVDQESAAT